MASDFWRTMSMQHWPDDVRRFAADADARRPHLRPFAEGETLGESFGFDAMEAHRDAWRDLARRSLEPNPFLEPEFALAAALHLPAGQRPEFVLVWQGAGFDPRARLIGLLALETRGAALSFGAGRSWRHRHTKLGTPLVDRFAGGRAVDALLTWLADRKPRQAAVMVQPIVRDGPLYTLLLERCAALGLAWENLNEHHRAILAPGRSGVETVARVRSTKHRREIDRLRRRLDEAGLVESRSATSAADIREAAEWFLAIEQQGWKGRRGTSFLSDVGDAAFLRSVVRLLAASGKCRIDWLALDGRPIAMAILLMSGDRAYFWKTAYDERYKYFSPGVQLAGELANRQLADPSVSLTDSCAIANHPMIDRMWSDRQPMVDLLIGVHPAGLRDLTSLARRERLRLNLRDAIKRVAYKALGRHAS